MPIADDFRASRDLDAVHDFFAHSQAVWESYESFVIAGHTTSVHDPATGTTIDGAGLLRIAPSYKRAYLANFTFSQFVSTFESFFFAFFHRVLQRNPWPYGQTQLDYSAVLRARDRDEIIAGVLLKQVNELKYEKVRDWFDALNKAVELGCPTGDEVDALAEIKATRDVLEHNAGIANEIDTRKAGNSARFAVGDHIEIDDNYHLASWQLVKKAVSDLTAAAIVKLAPP